MEYVEIAGSAIGFAVFYGMLVGPISAMMIGMVADGFGEVFVY